MYPGDFGIGRVSLDGNASTERLVESLADELRAKFSPDGRYFCFQSDETGRWGVHVVEISTDRRWILSPTIDGFFPFWARSGHRIT
jgi:Tol biopolymer transport system component